MANSFLSEPLTDILQNGGDSRDLPTAIVLQSDLPALPNKPAPVEIRDGLVQVRANLERVPAEKWEEAGFASREVVGLVRAEARNLLERQTRVNWRTVEDLLDDYLPAGESTETNVYRPDGGLRVVDVTELDMDIPYLVEGYVPAGQIGLVVGDNQLGKSFLMAALGGAVAYGREWIGQPTSETGHTLFLLSEARSTFHIRLAGWLVHEGILPESFTTEELQDTLEGKIDIVDGKPLLTDPRLEEHLVAEIEKQDTRLVVCDILSKLLGPEHHENDNATASAVTTMLSDVAERTGATVVLVHHIGHEEGRARGAHGWKDNVDFEFTVCGDNDEKPFERGIPLTLVNSKVKRGRSSPALRFRGWDVRGEADGESWRTGVAGPLSPSAEDAFDPYSTENEIRQFVRDRPGATKGELYDALSHRQEKIRSEIDSLIEEGKLENRGDDQSPALHLVPAAWPEEDQTLTAGTEAAPADLTGEDVDGEDGE